MLKIKIFIKSVLLFLYTPFYKKKCSVCGRKVYKFSPLPSFYSEDAKKYGFPYSLEDAETLNYKAYSCPLCGATDRDRLYALYLSKNIIANREYKLLDIAPSAPLSLFIKKYTNILSRSADLFMEGVDDKVDLMDMKIYGDNSFDIFVCSHVLEHVPNDLIAMKELFRVLKKNGFGIAMVPIIKPLSEIDEDISIEDPKEKIRRFGQDDHVRLYSKHGFLTRLQRVGFGIHELTVKDFSESEFILYGISISSILYIVTK